MSARAFRQIAAAPKVSAADMRRHLKAQDQALEEAVIPSIQILDQNEQATRVRVTAIEAILQRGLWGRLSWLVRGR